MYLKHLLRAMLFWLFAMNTTFADAIFDPDTNTIILSHVLAGDGSSQTESIYATNVRITFDEVISAGISWPPLIHPLPWPAEIDFFDTRNQELTISYITTPDRSIERKDVVINIDSVLGFDYSESIAAGVSDFKFRYVLDESLPVEWRNDFEQIMANLQRDIPIFAKPGWYSMPVFAWKSDAEAPLPFISGACICGGGEGGSYDWMSLEISAWEIENSDIHRYSVVPHEYFHVYQISHADLSGLKWLMEGPAATLESIYVQEHYGVDYFSQAQAPLLSGLVRESPSLYESFSASGEADDNYSGSVFLTLILAEELQNQGFSEAEAYRKIMKDFFWAGPNLNNWESTFAEVFSLSVDSFYSKIANYNLSYEGLLPSEDLTISTIFANH